VRDCEIRIQANGFIKMLLRPIEVLQYQVGPRRQAQEIGIARVFAKRLIANRGRSYKISGAQVIKRLVKKYLGLR